MYEEKLRATNAPEKVMFSLLSDIDLLKLNERARVLLTDISEAKDLLEQPQEERIEGNLSRKLSKIKIVLERSYKGGFHFKRIPATHVFLLMVSSELRNHKPCAVPVPYSGLKESDIRRLVTMLVQEMIHLGMKVAGNVRLPFFFGFYDLSFS